MFRGEGQETAGEGMREKEGPGLLHAHRSHQEPSTSVPSLERRDWRQGQLGGGEKQVWVLETAQGEGHGGRKVWMLGPGLAQGSLLCLPWLT